MLMPVAAETCPCHAHRKSCQVQYVPHAVAKNKSARPAIMWQQLAIASKIQRPFKYPLLFLKEYHA